MSELKRGARMATIKDYIQKISDGATLTSDEAADAFNILVSGEADPVQIGGFLMGLRMRGETVEEITGAATVMREKATGVEAPEGAVDTCGTGGDSSGTYNISTCSAFVVAGAGVPVAKHGNKSISSKSGSADVLTSLGVNLDVSPELVKRCIIEANIGFMFAPAHHSAMRHVGPARAALGVRTIFNLIGPLSNPAKVKHQVIGVFAKEWLLPIAQVMRNLSTERLWVVHGSDGLDELTTTGPSHVAQLIDGEITSFTIRPEDVGLAQTSESMLKGGDSEVNAAAIKSVLGGEKGPFRDIVLLNAGAALFVAGKAADLNDGVRLAGEAIDNGNAHSALEKLIAITAAS